MKLSSLSHFDTFGTRVEDIDLRKLSDNQVSSLKKILYNSGVMLIENQELTEAEYIQFGQRLGSLRTFVDDEYHHPEFPEIFVVSNVKRDGKRFGMDRVGYYWHSDCSFLAEPQPITMLYSRIVPDSGGETAFIDMRCVLKSLPSDFRSILNESIAEHEGQSRYIISEKDVGLSIREIVERDELQVPKVTHPVVIRHPFTGQEALYINEGFTHRILNVTAEESRKHLKGLFQAVWDSEFHYKHMWNKNQIILWDNRLVVHRAFPAKANQSRLMFRLGLSDGPFFGDCRWS